MTVAPTSVRLGGREWAIKPLEGSHEDLQGADGLCHYNRALLAIKAGQSPIDHRDTVLHELMHAIRYCQGRENGGKVEEDYVRSLATGLMAVFADNPEFAKWLTRIPKS